MLYPIGIQNFEKLRNNGYVYVDKTELIYKLVKTGASYFLSRPRRFGKSLLMSTLEAYFLGKKELFKGLAMERLEKDWTAHPVLHLDMNNGRYTCSEGLIHLIEYNLSEWEKEFSVERISSTLAMRFMDVIKAAYTQTGQRAVVLVDEYDKPLLEAIGNNPLQDEFRSILKPFYGTLKTCDKYLQFVMLTGVTKLGNHNGFSDINNLNDISLRDEYNSICGISESELIGRFSHQVEEMALSKNYTVEDMYSRLAKNYGGYHFSEEGIGMYNPFSLLKALKYKEICDYWYTSGVPMSLVKILRRGNYDISKFEGVEIQELLLSMNDEDWKMPIPTLFHMGCLTIKGYDPEFRAYKLGIPNKEVEEGIKMIIER